MTYAGDKKYGSWLLIDVNIDKCLADTTGNVWVMYCSSAIEAVFWLFVSLSIELLKSYRWDRLNNGHKLVGKYEVQLSQTINLQCFIMYKCSFSPYTQKQKFNNVILQMSDESIFQTHHTVA